MFRRICFALFAVAALSSCASDASTLSSQSLVTTTEGLNAVEVTDTSAAKNDFGSTFIGAPTAFWFWAPY